MVVDASSLIALSELKNVNAKLGKEATTAIKILIASIM